MKKRRKLRNTKPRDGRTVGERLRIAQGWYPELDAWCEKWRKALSKKQLAAKT